MGVNRAVVRNTMSELVASDAGSCDLDNCGNCVPVHLLEAVPIVRTSRQCRRVTQDCGRQLNKSSGAVAGDSLVNETGPYSGWARRVPISPRLYPESG